MLTGRLARPSKEFLRPPMLPEGIRTGAERAPGTASIRTPRKIYIQSIEKLCKKKILIHSFARESYICRPNRIEERIRKVSFFTLAHVIF
jgi:hypothetical protein